MVLWNTVNFRYSESKAHSNGRHSEQFFMVNSLIFNKFLLYITKLPTQIHTEYLATTNPSNSCLESSFFQLILCSGSRCAVDVLISVQHVVGETPRDAPSASVNCREKEEGVTRRMICSTRFHP